MAFLFISEVLEAARTLLLGLAMAPKVVQIGDWSYYPYNPQAPNVELPVIFVGIADPVEIALGGGRYRARDSGDVSGGLAPVNHRLRVVCVFQWSFGTENLHEKIDRAEQIAEALTTASLNLGTSIPGTHYNQGWATDIELMPPEQEAVSQAWNNPFSVIAVMADVTTRASRA